MSETKEETASVSIYAQELKVVWRNTTCVYVDLLLNPFPFSAALTREHVWELYAIKTGKCHADSDTSPDT